MTWAEISSAFFDIYSSMSDFCAPSHNNFNAEMHLTVLEMPDTRFVLFQLWFLLIQGGQEVLST